MMLPIDIAYRIMDDIKGRRGIGDEMDALDEDIKTEIIYTWAEIIRKGLKS